MTEQGITLFESGVSVTPRSLDLQGLTYDAWEEGYQKFIYVENCSQFWIGDYLNWGQATFGEQFSQALDEEHSKLHRVYMTVCSRIPRERRREALSYSIHKEVCFLDDVARQDQILDIAERENLTVAQVRELVRAGQGKQSPAINYWERFLKLLKDMWENLEEEVYTATVEKIKQHLG